MAFRAAVGGRVYSASGFYCPEISCSFTTAYNVAGGSSTAGSWQTRPLNTTDYNDISGAYLSSNQIFLPAGRYEMNWWMSIHAGSAFTAQSWCNVSYNSITTNSYFYGNVVFNDSKQDVSAGTGRIWLPYGGQVSLVYWTDTAKATDGLGILTGFLNTSIKHAQLTITKIRM